MSLISAQWKLSSDEERKEWKEKAKCLEPHNVQMLSSEKRTKLIAERKKTLVKEVCPLDFDFLF